MMGLGFLVALLALSAAFSAVETAFSTLTAEQRQRFQQRFARRGRWLEELLRMPERTFTAVLVGNLTVNTFACAVGYILITKEAGQMAAFVAVVALIALLYLIGEVIPKSFAIQHAQPIVAAATPFLLFWVRAAAPLLAVADKFSNWLCKSLAPSHWVRDQRSASEPTEDEYSDLLEEAEARGLLASQERNMIDCILALNKKKVHEIMVPQADMMTVDDGMDREQLAEALRRIKHSRVPVVHGSADEIVGIINAREFLLYPERGLDEVIELPSFVPETMSIARLLQTFQRGGHKLAIVVDEYGATAGIVTMEDIIEEIVGEIEDELDVQELLIQQVTDHAWLLNGKTRLDRVNETLGLQLASPGVDTIGGWLIAQLGAFPQEGERLKHEDLLLTVRRVSKHRIREILLERLPPPSDTTTTAVQKNARIPRRRKGAPTDNAQRQLPFDKGDKS